MIKSIEERFSMLFEPQQNELADMLRYKRPAGSQAEYAFRTKFLEPLGVLWDVDGNGILQIGNAPIIWSSHTDTVHWKEGRQDVTIRSAVHDRCFAVSEASNCLGADCTTGVFIMMSMIRNRVPGTYIFHYGEEKGCIGSRALVKRRGKELSTYKAAIAFDRMGYTDIVDTQNGSRCCSSEFTNSLTAILGHNYKASTGMYTDTGEYVEHVSECTNISVGYFSQHSSKEYQDVDFALWLANHMCGVNFESLVFKRKPESPRSYYDLDNYFGHKEYKTYAPYRRKEPTTIYDLVYDNPNAITALIETSELTFDDVKKWCDQYRRRT